MREKRPDVILLDINFPPDVAHGGGVAWDGFVLISWLGRMEETRNTPIIVITGEVPEKCEAKARASGAVGFLRKPISPPRPVGSDPAGLAGNCFGGAD